MSWLSGLSAVSSSIERATSLTSGFVIPPSGNIVRASWLWVNL